MNRIELNNEQEIAYRKQQEKIAQLEIALRQKSSELFVVGAEYTKKLCAAEIINKKAIASRMNIIFAKNSYAKYFDVKGDKNNLNGKKEKDIVDNTDSKINACLILLDNIRIMCGDSSKEYVKDHSESSKEIMRMCSAIKILVEQEIGFLKEARVLAVKRNIMKAEKGEIKRMIWAIRFAFKKTLKEELI